MKTKLNINKTKLKASGNIIFQHKRINWSTRYLGKDARTHIKKNKIKDVLTAKKKGSKKKKKDNVIKSQPPKNNRVVNILMAIMEPYSAKKNKAKPILEYSTLKPETSSDSASGRSNGARLVSAKIEIKNIKKSGKNGTKKNTFVWNNTISIKFSEPTQNKIAIKIKPKLTSYEIIWAALRIAPKKAYFELLDQPDKMTP